MDTVSRFAPVVAELVDGSGAEDVLWFLLALGVRLVVNKPAHYQVVLLPHRLVDWRGQDWSKDDEVTGVLERFLNEALEAYEAVGDGTGRQEQ